MKTVNLIFSLASDDIIPIFTLILPHPPERFPFTHRSDLPPLRRGVRGDFPYERGLGFTLSLSKGGDDPD